MSESPNSQIRRRKLRFAVTVIRRIRDIPNDRFGLVYTNDQDMVDIHEAAMDIIESGSMYSALKTALDLGEIEDIENDITGTLPKYSLTNTFKHHYTNLDPTHLYPSFFLTKPTRGRRTTNRDDDIDWEQIDDKIAGYKTTAYYSSPIYIRNYQPLICKPPYEDVNDLPTFDNSEMTFDSDIVSWDQTEA